MKTLIVHLSQYARYHRDSRNVLTHFIGVPMIMWALAILLSRPQWPLHSLDGLPASPALMLALALGLYYLLLDLRYGLCLVLLLAAMMALAYPVAQQSQAVWLGWGLGTFAAGWVIQLLGHYYEGKKPAFMDDVMGLLIGPVFLLAEFGFALGWRKNLQQEIERRVGPAAPGLASSLG